MIVRRLKNILHLIEAYSANIYYGFPSGKMNVIGITGTDGKTTTTGLIYHILMNSGKKAAMVSTLGAVIDNKIYDVGFHVTTPSSFKLQRYIKEAVNKGENYLVLEVTSHAIDQNRIAGINFQVGVLTNVTHEHLDYHKTYSNLIDTKIKLLKMSKISIVNKDDESYNIILKIKDQILKRQTTRNNWITYGLGSESDINPKNFPFKTNLIGEFNKYNCLAAISACKALDIDDNKIRKAILSYQPPTGRQELIYDKDFKVMIDFAHTPNAFKQILPELARIKSGRLIHVFGAAGKRDISKRPIMGEVSSVYSDIIILTAEDPRDEDISRINESIIKGINNKFRFIDLHAYKPGIHKKNICLEIKKRREAIRFAISIAQKGDIIVLTGKSHEKSMNYGEGEEPWDEYKSAFDAIQLKDKNAVLRK